MRPRRTLQRGRSRSLISVDQGGTEGKLLIIPPSLYVIFNELEIIMKKKSLLSSCDLLKEFKLKSKSLDLTEAVATKRKNRMKRENSKME